MARLDIQVVSMAERLKTQLCLTVSMAQNAQHHHTKASHTAAQIAPWPAASNETLMFWRLIVFIPN